MGKKKRDEENGRGREKARGGNDHRTQSRCWNPSRSRHRHTPQQAKLEGEEPHIPDKQYHTGRRQRTIDTGAGDGKVLIVRNGRTAVVVVDTAGDQKRPRSATGWCPAAVFSQTRMDLIGIGSIQAACSHDKPSLAICNLSVCKHMHLHHPQAIAFDMLECNFWCHVYFWTRPT